MKKKLALLCAVFVLMIGTNISARAEGLVIKGGLSYSNMGISSIANQDFRNYTGWHFGVGYQTGRLLGFSLQPELLYNAKGIKGKDANGNDFSIRTNYLEIPVNIQWGLDLIVARPFLMLTPVFGYNLKNVGSIAENPTINTIIDNIQRGEFGLGVGAGIDVWKLQITARYNWSFGAIDWNGITSSIKNLNKNTPGCLEISLGLRF